MLDMSDWLLDVVMPKAKWKKWPGKHITERQTKQNTLEELIQGALADLPQETVKLSIRGLWELRPEFAGFHPKARARALEELLQEEQIPWAKEGRSLKRFNMFEEAVPTTQ